MKENIVIEKLNGHDKEGKIGKILKNVGDSLSIGDTILTIESGKGALSVKSTWDGVILELSVEEGDKVTKGQIVGSVEAKASSKKAVANGPDKVGANLSGAKSYTFGLSKPVERTVDVDLLVVGGGPGGYVAAIRGAQSGLKVAIVEEDRLGGTCLNYGCIPTKAMASSVNVIRTIRDAECHGIMVPELEIDFLKLIKRKEGVVDQLVGGIEHLMNAHAIEYIKGSAKLNKAGELVVNTKRENIQFVYKNLILALGSSPSKLNIPGSDIPDILTSKELLDMPAIPKSITIIGGGVIGMEFAFIYRALGSEVNVVEFLPQILAILDEDVVDVIRESAREKGIKIFEKARATAIKETLDGSKLLEVEIENEQFSIASEKIAMAVGRKANLQSLDLDKMGIELNERGNGIRVNEFMLTNVDNIYAIGDVTNVIQLAHVASHQGITAVDHILGKAKAMDYDKVPSAIFTTPEIGQIGLSEKEAAKQNREVLIGKFPFMANGKALTMGENEGFVKLIADAKTRTILGGAVVGIHATDLMATIGNMVAASTKIEDAGHVIYAHPTTSESIHEAILMLDQKGIHFA